MSTPAILNFLSSRGYRISLSKVQLSTCQFPSGNNHYHNSQSHRKHLTLSLEVSSTEKEILSFLLMLLDPLLFTPCLPLCKVAPSPTHYQALSEAPTGPPSSRPDTKPPTPKLSFLPYITENEGYTLRDCGSLNILGP